MNNNTNFSFTYRLKVSAVAICLLFSWNANAHPDKLDSLLTSLREHPFNDTTRVNKFVQIAAVYRDVNLDSSAAMAMRGLSLADKIHFEKGRVRSMTAIGTARSLMEQFDEALSYLKKACDIAGKINDSEGMANAFFFIGVNYSHQAKYDSANEYFNRAINISRKTNNLKLLGNALDKLGFTWFIKGKYPEALDYFLKGLKIREQLDDKLSLIESLGDVAAVYSKLHDYDKALGYMGQALDLQKGLHNKRTEMSNCTRVADIYFSMGDLSNAIAAYRKALALSDSLGEHYRKHTILINMAAIYFSMGKPDSSMACYKACLKDTVYVKQADVIAMSHAGIGRILISERKVAEGIKELRQAFEFFKAKQMKQQITGMANDLSFAYAKINDDSDADEFNNISLAYRDSIYNDKNQKRIQQIQFDYQLNKKQDQIELLNKDKAIVNIRMWGLITGLGLLLAIVVILYRSRVYEKRSKERMIKQHEEIQRQAIKLEELNRFKDKTFSVLSHDLRGPLNAFSTTIAMMDEKVITVDEFLALKPEMASQLGSLNLLLENLLNWAKNYMKGETVAKPAITDLSRIIVQNISLFSDIAGKKQITINNNVPPGARAFCDAEQMDIVIRNLLNNAIKFTPGGGVITLSAQDDDETVSIFVKDTGVGMTQEHVSHLFHSIQGSNTYGTDGEKGTGLGLLLCYEFIKANKGNITVTSETGKGSIFTTDLPKN